MKVKEAAIEIGFLIVGQMMKLLGGRRQSHLAARDKGGNQNVLTQRNL